MNQPHSNRIVMWIFMLVVAMFLYLFNDASFYINTAYLITLYVVGMMIRVMGRRIPLRELTIFFTAVQYLLAPALDYQVLGKYTYHHMRVAEDTYFGYIYPAFFAFAFALFIPLGRKRASETSILERIRTFPENNRRIGIVLICLGLIFKYLPLLTGSIQSLNFIFTLLSLLRFIGILYIWLSDSKYAKWIIGAVLFEFAVSVFREAIFIQLIILMIFLYAYYALINKPNKVKLVMLGLVAGGLLFVLQTIKADYRKTVWRKDPDANKISLLSNLVSKHYFTESRKLSFLYTVAAVNVRLNQGWVMEGIMRNIPSRKPFFNGEIFWSEFYGLFLPRFIVLDKVAVQSADKFQRFAGYKIKNYTIAVGIFGDGYGNFGIIGGIKFCFLVGLFFNLSLTVFYRLAQKNPALLLWSIFIFFYLMRAGDDFYIITNWIIKSALLLFFIFWAFKKQLVLVYRQTPDKVKEEHKIPWRVLIDPAKN
jgi:hypothetical protein